MQRLRRLRELGILDTDPEPVFEALTRAAAGIACTPIALVSLIDADRQWFKSNVGLPGLRQTDREVAFCSHAILGSEVMEVADASADPRFAANPLVTGEAGIRFYAGAPITLADGLRMGTLCVLDRVPRQLNAQQHAALKALADAAAAAMALRAQAMQREAALAASEDFLDRTGRLAGVGGWQVDLATGAITWSDQTCRIHDIEPGYHPTLEQAINFYAPEAQPVIDAAVQEGMRTGTGWDLELPLITATGRHIWVRATGAVEVHEGRPQRLFGAFQDITERRGMQKQVAESERLLRLITDSIPLRIAYVDRDRRYRFVNAAHCSAFGLDRASIIGRTRSEVTGTPLAPAVASSVDAVLAGQAQRVLITEPVSGGPPPSRHIDFHLTPDLRDDGSVPGFFTAGVDITERMAMEQALAESHELLRVTLQSIGDAVITTDERGHVRWFNPMAERMTGWLSSEAQGKPLAQVFHIVNEDTRRPADNPVGVCLAQQRVVGLASDTVLISRSGAEHGIEDSAAPIRGDDGRIVGAVLVFHDVSAQRSMSREMNRRAKHDALTGMLNRVEFELRLSRVLEKSREDHSEHALMYIDLDQFKLVNDACGHEAGDQLLRQIADLLKDVVRSRDTVARLGGDEFAVILEHCAAEPAQQVGQKICDRMDEFRFLHDGRRFRVGASIGLVQVHANWADTAALMQAADTACFAAKEAGRNRVHMWFDTDLAMHQRSRETQWASRLERALQEHRFELYAQRVLPLHAVANGLHCEILLRLREEDGSIVCPNAFMPAAERFHMAARIDRWVLGQVIEWMRGHPDAHAGIESLAINLSGQSVGDRAFHRYAAELVCDAGFDPRKLCFEITETVAVTNLADATVFIDRMRALGVRIALDDFGAGASSFGYLKTLPVDLLKIDGRFIRDMVDDPLDNAAVRCFHEVARVIGVQTVAEFVEREDTLQALRELGVDFVQGYLMHRPQPLDSLVKAFAYAAS